MSDSNLMMDNIREEHKKGLPSKRKILSYLLDLLNKEKYPSLSDIEFYKIVGETYQINLDYKLNLQMLFYPVYNALKKKIKKLYSNEKSLEMEKYLIKNFGLYGARDVLPPLKKKIFNPRTPTYEILRSLYDLRTVEEFLQLSDVEFFDIIGETFKTNSDLFMNELYQPFRKRMKEIIGAEKLKEMERYIIEKFCLYEQEQIVYECTGDIKQMQVLVQKPSGKYKMDSFPLRISIKKGVLFFTNYRIIAQGKLNVRGGQSTTLWLWAPSLSVFSGVSTRAESKQALINGSTDQQLPCYGYQFPIENHTGLSKSSRRIAYVVTIENHKCIISITPYRFNGKEILHIFDILRKGATEVLTLINEIYEIEVLEKNKLRSILSVLKALRLNEEYQHISDSDYLNIVKETYKLDPNFFMTLIYPRMMSWGFPSFLSVRENIISLIENLKI